MPLLSGVGTSRLPHQQGGKRRNKSLLFISDCGTPLFCLWQKYPGVSLLCWMLRAWPYHLLDVFASLMCLTPAKHRPRQVKNMSNLIHPATVSSAAKPSVGILLKTWISASTPWLVVFAPHRESITSLDLLAMLCLMQPRKLLTFVAREHCQDMVSLVFTSDPSLSSDHLIFIQPDLCLYLCFSSFLSMCGTLNFLLLEIFLQFPSQ